MLLILSFILRILYFIFGHVFKVIIFVYLKAVSLRNFLSLLFDPKLFIGIEFVAFAYESNIGSFLLNFSILNFLFVLLV